MEAMEIIDILDSIQCHCHVMERTDTGQVLTSLMFANEDGCWKRRIK